MTLWELKKDGYAQDTIETTDEKLKHLSKYTDLNDPESVKAFIANKDCTKARAKSNRTLNVNGPYESITFLTIQSGYFIPHLKHWKFVSEWVYFYCLDVFYSNISRSE